MYSIILILFFLSNSFSLPGVVRGQDILNATQKYYLESESMNIDFSVASYNSLLKYNHTYEGSIYIKGEDFQLKTPSLEWVRINCILWKYSKTNEQVTISGDACDDENLNPLYLVNKILNWDLKKVRQYTLVRKDPQYKLNFIPQEEFYTTASLYISTSFVPRKLVLIDVAQNRTTYSFKKIQRNGNYKKISFQAPRDIEVIDLR